MKIVKAGNIVFKREYVSKYKELHELIAKVEKDEIIEVDKDDYKNTTLAGVRQAILSFANKNNIKLRFTRNADKLYILKE